MMKRLLLSSFIPLLFVALAASAQTQKPNIVVIATGGTIAGAGESALAAGYEPSKVPVEDLLRAVPEMEQLANLKGIQAFQISSQDMSNDNWLTLARQVNQSLASKDVDGVVITHGTDTMEETAYFLNLVVASDKPVVLVGAMRAATSLSADGPLNLYNAVAVAASAQAKGKGVLVVMNDTIFSARDVRKTNTTNPATFKGSDFGSLGYSYYGDVRFYAQPTRKHTYTSEFSLEDLEKLPTVEIVYGYANNTDIFVNAAVKAKAAGLISTGVGNGNQHETTLKALIKASKEGVIVVRSSRVGSGRVTLGAEVDDAEYGFVVADNLSPQKSRILLMLALTKTTDKKEIQRIFFEY